jgi:hypothetical protein
MIGRELCPSSSRPIILLGPFSKFENHLVFAVHTGHVKSDDFERIRPYEFPCEQIEPAIPYKAIARQSVTSYVSTMPFILEFRLSFFT